MVNRPLGVTIVAIIAWLSGLFQIIGSIVAILAGLFITRMALLGYVSLVVGIITLVVGVGLWKGNATARTIAVVVFAITIALEIVSVFAGGSIWGAIGGSILPIIGWILLYTRQASSYFRR